MNKTITSKSEITAISKLLEKHMISDSAFRLAEEILYGASNSKEINNFEEWLVERFVPQLIWLDQNDYSIEITRALFDAINLTGNSETDEFVQDWTDTTTGFLGEMAFERFIAKNFGIKLGSNINIRTGKFNALWLNTYNPIEIQKADAFVFVRVGILKEQFVGFLNSTSFLKSELFPMAEKLGELTPERSEKLLSTAPEFETIPVYISGFQMKSALNTPSHSQKFELLHGTDNWNKFVNQLSFV